MSERLANGPGRLQSLLERLRAVQAANAGITLIQACSKLFKLPSSPSVDFFITIAEVHGLVDAAKKEVEAITTISPTLLTSPFEQLQVVLGRTRFDIQVSDWLQGFENSHLDLLSIASDVISRAAVATKVVDEKVLEQLLGEVASLSDVVGKSDLDVTSKTTFLRHLQAIRYAIVFYELRGVDGLEGAMEAMVGFVRVQKRSILNRLDESSLGIYVSVASTINNVVAFAAKHKQIEECLPDMLRLD
jgi:hypothetical protein